MAGFFYQQQRTPRSVVDDPARFGRGIGPIGVFSAHHYQGGRPDPTDALLGE